MTAVLAFAVEVALLGWLLVVVPIQHFVYLICGAPARTLRRTGVAVWKDRGKENWTFEVGGKAPEDAIDLTYAGRPVTLTAALAAVVL